MKTKILRTLRQADGFVSGQDICNELNVSRTAVWKAVNQLKAVGYEIDAVQKKGYRITSYPDVVYENELQSIRNTQWAGQKIVYFDETDSTNTRAIEFAQKDYPNGTLVVAEKQTAGKGRRGRTWETLEGNGIFMSLMLKPYIKPNNASMLTLVAALSVAKAIADVTGEQAYIKWPNDIVMNGKKVCGILTEMSAQFDYINHLVIGIGINVHNKDFPEEIANMASSLMMECDGRRFHRADIIEKTLEYFEEYYEIFTKTENLEALVGEYNSILVNMHESVKVLDPKEPFEGKAMGITKNGELIVDTWESRKLVSSGEVSVRGIYGYV